MFIFFNIFIFVLGLFFLSLLVFYVVFFVFSGCLFFVFFLPLDYLTFSVCKKRVEIRLFLYL